MPFQILFLSGLGLTIGLKSTMQFFTKPKNYKVTDFAIAVAHKHDRYLINCSMNRVQSHSALDFSWFSLGGLFLACSWRHMALLYSSGWVIFSFTVCLLAICNFLLFWSLKSHICVMIICKTAKAICLIINMNSHCSYIRFFFILTWNPLQWILANTSSVPAEDSYHWLDISTTLCDISKDLNTHTFFIYSWD